MPRSRTLGQWQNRGQDEADEPPPGTAGDDPAGEPTLILRIPTRARVILPCPDCGADTAVAASFFARRTKDSDGTIALTLRTRAPKIAHSCDQMTLDAAATGPLSR